MHTDPVVVAINVKDYQIPSAIDVIEMKKLRIVGSHMFFQLGRPLSVVWLMASRIKLTSPNVTVSPRANSIQFIMSYLCIAIQIR